MLESLRASENDAGLQHICGDNCLTNVVIIFTLLFEAILGFSRIVIIWAFTCLQNLYGAKNMNMISTGAFQTEMDASNKQNTIAKNSQLFGKRKMRKQHVQAASL